MLQSKTYSGEWCSDQPRVVQLSEAASVLGAPTGQAASLLLM